MYLIIFAILPVAAETAFRYNRMGPFLFFVLMILFLKLSVELLTKREISIQDPKIPRRIEYLMMSGLWLTFWAVRFFHELEYACKAGPEPLQAGRSLKVNGPPDGDLVRASRRDLAAKRNCVANHDKR